MRKGMKKFTVPYSGTYFDGGRIYGQRVVFAENAEDATKKVQKTFDDREDEPITYAGKATKWVHGEVSDCEIYILGVATLPFWRVKHSWYCRGLLSRSPLIRSVGSSPTPSAKGSLIRKQLWD